MEKCKSGVEAAHKVWESYHNGKADVSTPSIDTVRDKLSSTGYSVYYWIHEVAPGRSAEYWWNEAEEKCMVISWNTQDKGDVQSISCDKKYGKNPAPSKK